eukprot:gene9013-18667_t
MRTNLPYIITGVLTIAICNGYVTIPRSALMGNRLAQTILLESSLTSPPTNASAMGNNYPIRSAAWARERGMEPGFGGIWAGNPDAKKYQVKVISKKSGEEFTMMIPNDRYIYHYFEENNMELPVINRNRMCRQGCCTVCAVKVQEGKLKMEGPLGLLKEFRDKGYALTCCALPRSDLVLELQDEDEVYIQQWGESFAQGGVEFEDDVDVDAHKIIIKAFITVNIFALPFLLRHMLLLGHLLSITTYQTAKAKTADFVTVDDGGLDVLRFFEVLMEVDYVRGLIVGFKHVDSSGVCPMDEEKFSIIWSVDYNESKNRQYLYTYFK